MRRVLSPLILILLVTQSFASTFEILKDRSPGRLESSDPSKPDVWIYIPAGTKGDIVGKKKFGRNWVYEFEVSSVGPAEKTSLVPGSKFWFPCQDSQCSGLVEFRNTKGHITSKPTVDDHFKTKQDASVRNTVSLAKTEGCSNTLDSSNASMIANQVDCLKKKSAPDQPIGVNVDPLFNDMLYYLNLLKPKQKSINAQVARYTLEFAQKKGIPPLFLLSICKAESSFNPNAKSTFFSIDREGRRKIGHAYGVCQLIQSTASSHSHDGPVTAADLKDIRTNLDLATDEIYDIMHMKTVKIPITGKSGQPVLDRHGQPTYKYMEISGKHPPKIPDNAIMTMDTPNYVDVLEAYNCGRHCLAKIRGGGMRVPKDTKKYAMDIYLNLKEYERLFADAHLPTTENLN